MTEPVEQQAVDPAFLGTLKENDIVRWYEMYADGFMVRETGLGIVVDFQSMFYLEEYVNYRILCFDGDIRTFPRQYLKILT